MTITSGFEESWQTETTHWYRAAPDRSLSDAVVSAVASTSGRCPTATSGTDERDALEPLYETIDPDALNSLFDPLEGTGPPVGHVEFAYCGYEVTVESSGLITVTEK